MLAVDIRYRSFPYDLVANFWGYQWARTRRGEAVYFGGDVGANGAVAMPSLAVATPAAPAEKKAMALDQLRDGNLDRKLEIAGRGGEGEATQTPKPPDVGTVSP